jgi:hypothetical protein
MNEFRRIRCRLYLDLYCNPAFHGHGPRHLPPSYFPYSMPFLRAHQSSPFLLLGYASHALALIKS